MARKERRLTNAVIRKVDLMEEYLNGLWGEYDREGNGCLGAQHTKMMIERITNCNASIEDVEDFIATMDDDGNNTIQQDDLQRYIVHAIQLSMDERKEYASRGPLQALLVRFVDGVDREFKRFQLLKHEKAYPYHKMNTSGQHFVNPLYGEALDKLRTPSSQK